MANKRRVPRPAKAAAKMVLIRVWLKVLSLLPGALSVGLVAGMVVMFVLVLADVACMDAGNVVAVAE
ncbi:MAG: hypothetical protein VR65_06095 [Desulfobulbaceae bacterium BRH_c16a]|nr:MAG: hypothetical protein VR65_06095 [Desulfobulbaceae bacterium BRH_c16a]